jgi:hypothetical protein
MHRRAGDKTGHHMRYKIALTLLLSPAIAYAAQDSGNKQLIAVPANLVYTYADLADLAIDAPVVLSATVSDAIRLKDEQATGVAPGHARFYVSATVQTLIRGAGGVASQVNYLFDVALDSRGKAPKLKKSQVILIATSAKGGDLRLATPDAQLPWSAQTEATLRAILIEASRPDAPPRITGVGNAFSVPGSLPGESETQIFLKTADNRPVSLSILRRPGEEPRWAVALSEIVDDAAAPPARDTLLWYRLACSLPPTLPDASLQNADPDSVARIHNDYALVIDRLGRCVRNRR